MRPGTVVEYKGTRGVVVNDFAHCCTDSETPVVFEGITAFRGVPTKELAQIGPENAVADFKKCGAGEGEKCCIFLVGGAAGAECARFGEMRYTMIFKRSRMNAKRHPTKLFPACQDLSDGL